jgi:hypothetical protein
MSNDISNLKDTIVPKSDQLNADQLIGGPITVTVTGVRRGSGDDQPVVVHYEGEAGRPYKPCLTMRKVLIFAWGEDGSNWVGRMLTLYNKRDVKWGGVEVGGIRISHMSHVDDDIKLSLAATRGKKEPIIIKRLDASDGVVKARAALDTAARGGMESLKAAWAGLPASVRTAIGGAEGCPAALKAVAQAVDAPKPEAPQVAAQEVVDTETGEVTTPAIDNPDTSHF